jgi:hypothetical protein
MTGSMPDASSPTSLTLARTCPDRNKPGPEKVRVDTKIRVDSKEGITVILITTAIPAVN